MNQGGRGTRAENAVADELGACGYDVVRSAASKGAADLVAVHDGEILFVQVKLVAAGRTYKQPSPLEREQLVRMARRCGPWAVAVVAARLPGAGSRPARTVWRELTGTGPAEMRDWIPRELVP
jgi:Holliday junction resolvase